MTKKFNKNSISLLKGVERAKKLKDLEIAKSLEVTPDTDAPYAKTTPKERSDLPKE